MGSLEEARKSNSNYKLKFSKWKSTLEFETPNYKIWVGNFRTKLEADRALLEIKKTFQARIYFQT